MNDCSPEIPASTVERSEFRSIARVTLVARAQRSSGRAEKTNLSDAQESEGNLVAHLSRTKSEFGSAARAKRAASGVYDQ